MKNRTKDENYLVALVLHKLSQGNNVILALSRIGIAVRISRASNGYCIEKTEMGRSGTSHEITEDSFEGTNRSIEIVKSAITLKTKLLVMMDAKLS